MDTRRVYCVASGALNNKETCLLTSFERVADEVS